MNLTIKEGPTFDLIAGSIRLLDARPSLDGVSVCPRSTSIERTPTGGRIVYELDSRRSITLELDVREGVARVSATLSGFAKLPFRFAPVCARVEGVGRAYQLGLGFSGPSGVIAVDRRTPFESVGVIGLLAHDASTLAIGATDHRDFLQRSSVFHREARRAFNDREIESSSTFLDIAFLTEGITVDGTIALPPIEFRFAPGADDALRDWAVHTARRMNVGPLKPSRFHWCSWYEKGCNFSRADLDETLRGLRSLSPPVDFQAIQIDDGYCDHPGDWLTPNRLWPGDLRGAFGAIRDAGLDAGIWVAPFMVGSLSALYRAHPDWVVKDHSGKPIPEWKKYDASGIPSHTDPEHYALDASHPQVVEYVGQVFRTMRQWGATFFKTDFMDWGLKDTARVKRYDPRLTSVQAMRRVLQTIRDAIGPDSYWLACISPYTPFIGFADGMRIANDIGPAWGEGSAGNMIHESIGSHFLNGILWQNDPDAILLRDYHNDLTDREVRMLALWCGLLGTSVNISDRADKLPTERLELLRRLKPATAIESARIVNPTDDRPIKVIVRDYPHLDAHAVLAINPTRSRQTDAWSLGELGVASGHRWFEWHVPGSAPIDAPAPLVVRLDPHESRLFFVGADAPPDELALGGGSLGA